MTLRSYGLLWRDAATKAPSDAPIGHVEMPGCLCEREPSSVNVQDPIVPLVVGLRQSGRPVAIVGRVWAVVVSALDRVSRRADTHIRKEGGEALSPPIAHHDASCAVVTVLTIRRVVAALLRIHPYRELGRMMHSVGAMVGAASTDASAAVRQSSREHVGANRHGAAAVASAQPPMMFADLVRWMKNTQAAEANARQIVRFHGAIIP